MTEKKVATILLLINSQWLSKSFLCWRLLSDSQGFGVRAGEAILRGTFVCEYIGEVLEQQEAHNRRGRFTFLPRRNFFFCMLDVSSFLLTWPVLIPNIAKKIAVISSTLMLVLTIWVDWSKDIPDMSLILLHMEMCLGSSITGEHRSD